MNTQQQNNQPDYIWAYAGIPNALYTDTIFKFNNGYTVRISDDLEREVRSNNIEVDTWGVAMVFHKDRDMAVAEYHYYDDYNEKDGYGKSSEIWFVDEETGENDPESFEGYNVDILGNQNWKEDLAKAMVSFAVSKEVETGLNADKEFSGSPEIVSVTRDNYAAANRYAQNAAKNPIFLEKIDNRHQPVMPFDDFVAVVMKDTGDSRDEVVELASEAFRSQYQAASGYLRGVSDGSVMYNAFDIEMDDKTKTYYATAPLKWVKEQARVGLSDRGYALEVARHNFLHSSLNGWETAFHQLKVAADDYKQWRNQVCAFFNFRQPEITLQQDEWTQVAQFVNYNQEWEQLDNARLMISEFTPQQAYEFLGVYQQYQRYVRLAIHNAEQGIDSPELRTQIAAIKQFLNEKVAQNLPLTENRQVMFDLFGTQLGLFDEETQEQGVGVSESPENSVESQSETVSMEELDRRLSSAFGGEDSAGFQNQKMYDYYSKKDGVSIYHPNGLMNKPLETLSFSELEDRYEVLDYHFNAQTPQTLIDEMRAIKALLEVKGLEIIATAADNYTPKNAVIAQWAKNNGFEFELATNDREVFQKGNLKFQVANISQYVVGQLEPQWIGGRVSLVQFDKSLPTTEIRKQNEIEQNAIKPIRHETVFIWDIRKETTDEFGRLSQFLSEMEQGVSVSATPENSQETQPETVSGSPNSKFLGKEFTIDGDTLIQIKSRKIDKQFTDLGYKTELEIHAIHGNLWTARNISEQDFQRLAGKKGYGLFYDTSKREFVAVGGKMGERRLFEMPASQFGKEFETLLTELRNTYNIDGSKIVNSQTESLSGSPTTQEQGISASKISANEVKQDLAEQPETVVDNSQNTIEKLVDDYIRATAHNSRLENYQAIMRNYFLQKIDGNNPFFENRPDKMVRAEWLLSLAQNPKNFITIKNREMPELKVVIIDNQKVDIAPDEIRFFNYLREQQRIGLAEKTPVADKSIKELKAELKVAKDALTAAKKELKGLRDEFDSKRGYSYFNTHTAEVQIIHKQQEVLNWQNQFDNLTLQFKTQTGEITDLEREILTTRLSGNIDARVDIVRRELKTQKDELRQQYDEMGERIKKGEVYEFEIQSVMQEAVDYYSGIRGIGTIYHNNKPLPLNTDREKAIAYLLKQELPRQQFEQFGKPHNRIIHQLNNRLRVRWGINFTTRLVSLQTKYLDAIESAENQLMKGSIEDRAEINLTYDINTPDGEQKVRELFYGSRHDEAQAELFERVFAMAQKLGVEVRHALRDSGENKEINKFVLGQYSLAKNSARVKHNGYIKPEQKGEVLLHELVHSVTSRAMLLKEQGHTELLNPAQVKAIDEIERIYQAVVAKAEELGFEKYQEKGGIGIGGDYGLKNSHEFIAELSNPVFREKLKQVAMFDDTVKAITEVATGVEKTETAYDRLTAALYQIIDNYDIDFGAKYEQAKYGNIKMHDMNRLPENYQIRAADFDDFNPELDGKTITPKTLYSDIYTDITPEQQGKTVGEVLRNDENALWDAEFWGELVGHGVINMSDDLVEEMIEYSRYEVLEEIVSCGNVPFNQENIEYLYEREPDLVRDYLCNNPDPKIAEIAKSVVHENDWGARHRVNMAGIMLEKLAPELQAAENRINQFPDGSIARGHAEEKYNDLLSDTRSLQKELQKAIKRAENIGVNISDIAERIPVVKAEFDRALNSHLEDGKRLQQADEKVKNAEWECAKRPNIREPYNNLQAAIAERDALNEEIKPRVQAAMDSGKPYIVDYSEDGKPLELVVTQNGNLKMALGSYEKEPNHNYLLSIANGEVALNAEQRSTPERVAEVLKYNFNQATTDISEKLAIISYPAADKVFSEQEIKDTLNKALRSSFKEDQLAAIKSPVMRGEWLSQIADNPKATKELRQAAKNEMAERYGTPETMVEQPTEKIGVSSPEHEEELATVADDDYERD